MCLTLCEHKVDPSLPSYTFSKCLCGNYSKILWFYLSLVIVRARSSHECKSTSFTELQNTLQALVLEEPRGSNGLVLKVEGFRFFFFFFSLFRGKIFVLSKLQRRLNTRESCF